MTGPSGRLALGVARPLFSIFCCPSGETSGRESGILTPFVLTTGQSSPLSLNAT